MNIPALILGRDDAPPVLWFHGFGVDKETHRAELEQLAAAGFRAVGVDAAGHGARRLPDLDARIAAPREEAKATMLELARATATEIPAFLDTLRSDRVAIAGVSMGGYVVYGALGLDPRIRAAVAILGDPELLDDNAVARRVALLSITAECDENVPPHAARALHERLHGVHRYVELAGEPHLLSERAWKQAMDLTIEWLRIHLLDRA
jgi:pimeloyl-ACP methyl ester carboxylesterase